MKSIKDFIREQNMVFDQAKSGVMDINDGDARDNVNNLLLRITSGKFLTPYIALEKVSKLLANYQIHVPYQNFMEGDTGILVIPASQFGEKTGMKDDGTVVTVGEPEYNIFFEWQTSDCGMFEVFCNIVDKQELDEILADVESEANEDDEEMNESLQEMDMSTYKAAKKEAQRRKSMADRELKTEKKPGMRDIHAKYSKTYGKYVDLAKRRIADKKAKLDEISSELVGKVNSARSISKKPSKTVTASKTLSKAVNKKWLASGVGRQKDANGNFIDEQSSDNDAPMANKGRMTGSAPALPSGKFDKNYIPKSDGKMDKLNKDEDGNTVVEGSHTNKELKNKAIVLKFGTETERQEPATKKLSGRTLRVARRRNNPKVNEFDIRNLKVAEETETSKT